jgi:hypothetical protein
VPFAGVTNVGMTPGDVQVRAVIGLAQDADQLRQWLRTNVGNPPRLWEAQQTVPAIAPADTVNVALPPWQLPQNGGDFWFGFRVMLPGDPIPENDGNELFFSLAPEIPPPGKPDTPPR